MYDWIVVGNGLTGAAISYEIAQQGLSVLVIEQDEPLQGATRHSYGTVAHWAGNKPPLIQLCKESLSRYRQFTDELDYDVEFRELDALMTIPLDTDPSEIAQSYAHCAIPPQVISREQACEMEPLLNKEAIAAALTVPHGHVNPEKLVHAYNAAFLRAKGTIKIAQVTGWVQEGDRITGVMTTDGSILSQNTIVCAGGWTRQLLRKANLSIRQYFTHSESIEGFYPQIELQTIVMPVTIQRITLEANASSLIHEPAWDKSKQEILPHILDAGAIQFKNRLVRMGQISRVLTDPTARINAVQGEQEMRAQIGQILPCLKTMKGQWHHCLVAFTADRFPLIGPLPHIQGLHLFSGFDSPFTLVPPLAQRFARYVTAQPSGSISDSIIEQMRPERPSILQPKL